MKRVAIVMSCAMLGACAQGLPAQLKKELPPAAAVGQKPELTLSLVERTIVKGKTTKKEVVAAFGAPKAVERNSRRLSREELERVKVPLPPVARTAEFWKYWSIPAGTAEKGEKEVFNLLIFFDDHDVALDYLTAKTSVSM